MNIVKSYPPNWEQIRQAGLGGGKTLYCFGSTVYNPHNIVIEPDIELHESVHISQQTAFATPELWWAKYLHDSEFRLSQEVEAFFSQWQFVKKVLGDKVAKDCLDECAENLSSKIYGLSLNFHQARTRIRKHALPIEIG